MKRIFSLMLAVLLLVSAVPMAQATNDYTVGTRVEYTAANNEAYTITVPAQLAPGGSGTVTLSGTWADNRIVTVTADPTVTLKNSIKETDTKTLNVNFDGISEAGSNTTSQTFTKDISVDGITDALFGTWSGKFNYNVDVTDSASTNEYGFYFGRPYSTTNADVFFEDGSSEVWVNGECVETLPAGTWTYSDHRLNRTDGELIVSADGLIMDDVAIYMDGYDNGGSDPVLNEYGFYFEEFYMVKASFILYEDGSGIMYCYDNPELNQSFPAGSFTYTNDTITMGDDSLTITNNGTVISDPNDPSFSFILEK